MRTMGDKMVGTYFYKLRGSILLKLGILGVTLICFTRVTSIFKSGNVCGEFDLLLGLDTIRKVIAVFGALPFTANFSVEWNNAVSNMYIVRCGLAKYTYSNVIVTFLSTIITVFSGIMFFVTLMSFFMPFSDFDSSFGSMPYGTLLKSNFAVLYIVLKTTVFAFSCAMWSVIGLTLSAFFPNKYVALCAPFAASYIIERITIQFPAPFNLWTVSVSALQWENPTMQFLYSIGLFTIISAIFGVVFTYKVKRMVQNEIR